MKIELIKNNFIDKGKYDHCIENAHYGTIYALSWYLDIVAPNWDLLATSDYSFVMPLPRKKKWGIGYALQPPLCQQLGIFSEQTVTEAIFCKFIERIPDRYCILQLNPGNFFPNDSITLKKNYILPLFQPYEEIRASYRVSKRQDLKNTAKKNLFLNVDVKLSDFLFLIDQHSLHYKSDNINLLTSEVLRKDNAFIWGIQRSADSELIAAAFFLHWNNRLYYIISATSPEGRDCRAMHFLIDQLIQKYSQSKYILDFEGSSISSVASFYKSFGAVDEGYPLYYKNRLPWPLNLIKKNSDKSIFYSIFV